MLFTLQQILMLYAGHPVLCCSLYSRYYCCMLTTLCYAVHSTADNFRENSMQMKAIASPLTPFVGSSVCALRRPSFCAHERCERHVYCLFIAKTDCTRTPTDGQPTSCSHQGFCGKWPWSDQGAVNVSACTSYYNELTLYTFKFTCFQVALLPLLLPYSFNFYRFSQSLPYKAKRFFLVNLRREFEQRLDLINDTRPVYQTKLN